MMNLTKALFLLPTILSLVVAMPLSAFAQAKPVLEMWVWSEEAFVTEASRQDLIDFCGRYRIGPWMFMFYFIRQGKRSISGTARRSPN